LRVGIGPFAGAPSGLAVATVDTASALVAAGVDVTVFADSAAALPPGAEWLEEHLVRLAPMPEALRKPRVGDAVFLASRLGLSRRWARAVREHPVDVIHAFSPGTAALLPRPTPVVVQAWFHPPRLRQRLRTMLQFARRSPPMYAAHMILELQAHSSDLLGYRRADLVLANTVPAERAFQERGIEVRHVPPCISLPEVPPAREPSDRFRITFCAHRLETPRKGLGYVLDALRLLAPDDVELTLFGIPGTSLDDRIESTRRAGVEVDVRGHVPRQEYLDHLARDTDLLVFPSLYEEWGYALLEGFSRGVPALAFDVYPFYEIVDGNTGVLVTPRDVRAVADGLARARAGALPAPHAVMDSVRERYGSASVAKRLVPLYDRLASELTPQR
jgi:glycosyltransferase involved in cell wall biosynthesis